MNFPEFAHLPENARVWVYGFAEPLSGADAGAVREALREFLPNWVSHGARVESGFKIVEDRFVVLAGHIEGGVSGCSIDSSVRVFKQLKEERGLDGLNRGLVFYRDSKGKIQAVPFTEFNQVVDSGEITAETPTFDTTIQTLSQLNAGMLERAFKDSWHARSFPLPQPAQG